jgi:hypothetical protein
MFVRNGAAVNESVNFSGVKYAVIEALQTAAGSEQFVIAYRSEESLHDVIAVSCIVALGFSSRGDAIASAKTGVSAQAA